MQLIKQTWIEFVRQTFKGFLIGYENDDYVAISPDGTIAGTFHGIMAEIHKISVRAFEIRRIQLKEGEKLCLMLDFRPTLCQEIPDSYLLGFVKPENHLETIFRLDEINSFYKLN
jgi:hypothetical protein